MYLHVVEYAMSLSMAYSFCSWGADNFKLYQIFYCASPSSVTTMHNSIKVNIYSLSKHTLLPL
jgi:hypothetical protein